MRDKTRPETRRRPVVLPLRGAEVLVAVRGPSPGEGGREKNNIREYSNTGGRAPARRTPGRTVARRAARPPGPRRAPRQRHVTKFCHMFGKILLVFGYVSTDLCKEISVLQHFLRFTRLSSSHFEF